MLKRNITLQLDKGATLPGSPDHSDYPARIEFRLPAVQSMVSTTNAEEGRKESTRDQRILSADSAARRAMTPQPVTRLTPLFHDIVRENVTSTGGEMAGAIVGLPESPVSDVVCQNVHLSGKTGLSIGFANVKGNGFEVHAANGDAILKRDGANLTPR